MLHHIVVALGQVPSFYTATVAPQAADADVTFVGLAGCPIPLHMSPACSLGCFK